MMSSLRLGFFDREDAPFCFGLPSFLASRASLSFCRLSRRLRSSSEPGILLAIEESELRRSRLRGSKGSAKISELGGAPRGLAPVLKLRCSSSDLEGRWIGGPGRCWALGGTFSGRNGR